MQEHGHDLKEVVLADDRGSRQYLSSMLSGAFSQRIPRLLPVFHPLQYIAARRMIPDDADVDAAHVIGGSALHGYGAARRWPMLTWLGTTIADERSSVAPYQSVLRRSLHRVTLPSLRRIEARIFGDSSRILAQSPHTADQIVAGGISASKVEVVPVPIDTATFRPGDEERRGILFVGRANDPRKNFGACLDLLRSSETAMAAGLSVVSSKLPVSPQVEKLRDGLQLLGAVDNVADTYRKARVFLCTSVQEGFGIAVFEAMASGTPVVVRSCGGPDAYVRASGGGFLVHSQAELVQAVERVLRDDSLAADLGAAGRAWTESNLSAQQFLAQRDLFLV